MPETPEYKELREAAEDIWDMLEKGQLVRDTSNDHESGWLTRQVPIVQKLARFGAALGKS